MGHAPSGPRRPLGQKAKRRFAPSLSLFPFNENEPLSRRLTGVRCFRLRAPPSKVVVGAGVPSVFIPPTHNREPTTRSGDQGKPGKPGHRNIGRRASCGKEGDGQARQERRPGREGTGKQERKGFTMRDRGVRRPRGNLPDSKFPRRKSSKTACRSRRASGLILMPTNSAHDHLCVNLHAPAVLYSFGCSSASHAGQGRSSTADETPCFTRKSAKSPYLTDIARSARSRRLSFSLAIETCTVRTADSTTFPTTRTPA